jgi:hypothetical protein
LENQEHGRILKFFLEKYCASRPARHTQILEGPFEKKKLPQTRGHTQNLGTFQGKKVNLMLWQTFVLAVLNPWIPDSQNSTHIKLKYSLSSQYKPATVF